jgi:hypothetical protein
LAADPPDWLSETIDDEDWLYRRVPPVFVKPVCGLQARCPRSLDLTATHTPDQELGNRAHASIRGNEGPRAKQRCFLLAEEAAKHILIRPT